MTKREAIQKVMKLKALANGTNYPDEAATARQAAERLTRQYKLSAADFEQGNNERRARSYCHGQACYAGVPADFEDEDGFFESSTWMFLRLILWILGMVFITVMLSMAIGRQATLCLAPVIAAFFTKKAFFG